MTGSPGERIYGENGVGIGVADDGRVRGERERVELAALDGDAGSAADDVGNTGRGGADAVFDGFGPST